MKSVVTAWSPKIFESLNVLFEYAAVKMYKSLNKYFIIFLNNILSPSKVYYLNKK